MPSYKTHSIHGELILPDIDQRIEIKKEDLKSYCMGPDAMILTDYKTFDYQHAHKTKEFFMTMLKMIKENKLYENSEAMAYLYGQLDHFVLDSVMHPFIYYMTEGLETQNKIPAHGLTEMWIDDYTSQKYGKTDMDYYRKLFMRDKELRKMVSELYNKVYGVRNEGVKYSLGMFATALFDSLARKNQILITPEIVKIFKTGDFTYQDDLGRVIPFLNLSHETWINPETGETYQDSFDDLWDKSKEVACETIEDVNKYLYQDRPITNPLITNNTSFNTGIPCELGQSLKHIKKY